MVTYIGFFFPAFKALITFPPERAVILRERTSGSYRLSAYFIAKSLNEIPFLWEMPLLMIVLTYFSTGLNLTPGAFFTFVGVSFLSAWTSSSLGLWISAISGPNFSRGITLLTITTLLIFLNAGFFVSYYPTWIRWTIYLSYMKNILDSYIINDLSGTMWKVESACGLAESLTNVNSTVVSGDAILATYPIILDSVGLNVLVILGWGVLFRLLGLLALQITIKVPKPKKKNKKSK